MLLVALGLAVAYAYGLWRLRVLGRSWPAARTVAFGAGVVCVAAAGIVPESSFALHMTGHVLVAMGAPLGLALGAPVTLALQGATPAARRRLLGLLHSCPARLAAHPLAGWVLFGGGLAGFYLSPLFPLSLRHEAVHVAVHLHFLVAGCLFVWPVAGADPVPRRAGHGALVFSVLLAVPFHAVVGLAITSASRPLAPGRYPDLADQRAAGAIGWGAGELFAVVLIGVAFSGWVAADRREARRLDRRLDAGVSPEPSVSGS